MCSFISQVQRPGWCTFTICSFCKIIVNRFLFWNKGFGCALFTKSLWVTRDLIGYEPSKFDSLILHFCNFRSISFRFHNKVCFPLFANPSTLEPSRRYLLQNIPFHFSTSYRSVNHLLNCATVFSFVLKPGTSLLVYNEFFVEIVEVLLFLKVDFLV